MGHQGQEMQQQQMAVNGRVAPTNAAPAPVPVTGQPAYNDHQHKVQAQPQPTPLVNQMTSVQQNYHNEIMAVFMSQAFMTGT